MGSDTQAKLPTIEFNEKNSTPGTISWKSTSNSVRQALESYGCFVVSHDNLMSSELHNDMFALTEELFRLPLETKRKHSSTIAGSGYGGKYSIMPLFENFGVEDAGNLGAAQKFAALMWPNGRDNFCETMTSYTNSLSGFHGTVIKMVASCFGLEKYYEPLMESSLYVTRLMKYNSPGENQSGIGIVAHRDKSFMTVLDTNEVKGLEIETRDGHWIDYEPSPGKFIVIVGEAFMAWSNGRIYCPLHKVVARGTKDKYSIGVFSFIRGTLQVPEELIDDENPLKFKSFSNFEFVEHCREGGPKMAGAIQTYCGI